MKQEPTAIGTNFQYVAIYSGDRFFSKYTSNRLEYDNCIVIDFPIASDFEKAWFSYKVYIIENYPIDDLEHILHHTQIYKVFD